MVYIAKDSYCSFFTKIYEMYGCFFLFVECDFVEHIFKVHILEHMEISSLAAVWCTQPVSFQVCNVCIVTEDEIDNIALFSYDAF